MLRHEKVADRAGTLVTERVRGLIEAAEARAERTRRDADEEARRHPARHIVTRCLGRDPVDVVDTWVLHPRPGERWLLCTDGLTNEVGDDEIAGVLAAGDDPQEVADTLVARAVEHGGRDNVTVVVVISG